MRSAINVIATNHTVHEVKIKHIDNYCLVIRVIAKFEDTEMYYEKFLNSPDISISIAVVSGGATNTS